MGIIEKIGEISNREDFRIIDKNKIEINIPVSKLEDFLSNIKKIIIDEKISQS